MNLEKWNKLTKEEKQVYKAHVNRKIKRQRQLIAGDLVVIGPWCANKFRLAHVVEVAWFDSRNITIQYLDKPGLKIAPSRALSDNLELVLPEEQSLEDLNLPKQEFDDLQEEYSTRVDPYLLYHRRG